MDPPDPAVLPPDNTFGTVNSLGFAGNWLIRGSGVTAGDVPWVSEAPITGTVSANSTFPVDITFTSAITQTPGIYTATLRIKTDDPLGGMIAIPVTMNVVTYDLELEVDAVSKTGLPGEAVVYNLTLTNTSLGKSDSFDLSLLPDSPSRAA